MFTKSSKWQPLGIFAALAILAAAAACSGGSNPTPAYPASQGNLTGGGTYQVNAINGMNSTISISGTGTMNVQSSASAPTVGALPQAKQRTVAGSSNKSLIYYTVTAASAVTIKSLTIQIGFAAAPTTSVYLAYWNGQQWVASSTPGAYSNGVVTLSLPSSALPITLAAGQSLYLVAYQGQQVGTPPPPPPSISPAPAATMAEGTQQLVTVYSKPGFTITATTSNSNLVAVSPTAAPVSTPSTGSGSATFTLTAGNTVGTATVTFTDSIGQKTSIPIVTSDTYSASPAPGAISLSAGDTADVSLTTKPNTSITAVSSNTSVATVPASETGSSNGGLVTYPVTAVGPGSATITFTDQFGNSGVLAVQVSSIANGAFTNGLAAWSECSYNHAPLTSYVNPSPSPAAALPTQSPGALSTPVSIASPYTMVAVVSPPPNDRINFTAQPTAAAGATPAPTAPPGVGVTPPPVLGSRAALIGSTTSTQRGEIGICQTFTVSAASPYLSFWVWEGGGEYTTKYEDQNAEILNASGTTIVQTLFQELNCYQDYLQTPTLGPADANSNGCDPGGDTGAYNDWVNGGYWVQRGPYDLTSLAGTSVTLYVGQWFNYTDTAPTKYSEFMFLGNVQTSSLPAFPTTTPSMARRLVRLTLKPRV